VATESSLQSRQAEPLRATGVVIALTTVLAVMALAFALPAAKSKPQDIPIGAVGPPAASGQAAEELDRDAPGAFKLSVYPDEDALRAAIRDRDVYGGIVMELDHRALLIATGASPTVAQLLTQIGNGMSQRAGGAGPATSDTAPLRTEDLAGPPAGDPRGTGLAAAALPITLAGFLSAVALTLVVRRDVWLRVGATAAFSALAGVTIAALLRYPLGSIDQNFWAVAGGLALGALASGLLVLGLGSLFGRVGLALGALLALLVGNPLSGMTSAPEMLPGGWGEFGQFLPQGANATLLRSTAFFDGAGSSTAIAVLICWAVVGSLIIVIAAQRHAMQSIGRLDRLETQPNPIAARALPVTHQRVAGGYLRDRVPVAAAQGRRP
jgi:hypothetical protein